MDFKKRYSKGLLVDLGGDWWYEYSYKGKRKILLKWEKEWSEQEALKYYQSAESEMSQQALDEIEYAALRDKANRPIKGSKEWLELTLIPALFSLGEYTLKWLNKVTYRDETQEQSGD